MAATPHSASCLSAKQRDFWWDHDYLELIAKRVDFTQVKSALDVGCGKGAWTWVISSLLPENAKIIGVDQEIEWISSIIPPSDRFSFAVANANNLPFEDESFDLVTCQTLLMHVSDAKRVLDEMARVLKPGGLLVLSEPTNMANLLYSNTAQMLLSLEESVDVASLYLICQKGKEICGDGFSSIGLHLNYLLPSNISYLHSFMAEKMMVLTPPYKKEEEVALLDFVHSFTGDNWYYFWSKEKARKYFFAIYPDGQQEFDRLWQIATKLNEIYRQQIQERKLGGVFGGHLILTVGKK
ncbi:MAG: class I SAM-dependent methyltransferase [Chlamydiota bacterium]